MPWKKKDTEDSSFEAESCSGESFRGNYKFITYQDRINLINMVCIERKQILQAAAELNIKISTAKYILKCFKKNGKILKKGCMENGVPENYQQEISTLKAKADQVKRLRNEKKRRKAAPTTMIVKQECLQKKDEKTEEAKSQQKGGQTNLKEENKTTELAEKDCQIIQHKYENQMFAFPLLNFYSPYWFYLPH